MPTATTVNYPRKRQETPIKAIRAQIRAAESEMALLQNAGILPTPLSRIAYDRDAHRAASRAVEVL
ncbi:MAG TPA: hypothetical protein VNR66_13505, partial [Solirubrobacteraceae bacterium]|nr:hypothetical protein [Solirubrobacteraceae bacterium]